MNVLSPINFTLDRYNWERVLRILYLENILKIVSPREEKKIFVSPIPFSLVASLQQLGKELG